MRLLEALKGNVTDTPPVWLMRQAGRYLPEYKELRRKAAHFIAFCQTPAMAAEATLQPLRRFDLDAAIIFSDILLLPHALGQSVTFTEGEGPRFDPLKTPEDLKRLRFENFKNSIAPTCEAISLVRARLSPEKALIGFAGAPWTVACYMLEGRGSKAFEQARYFAYGYPEAFQNLINLLTEATIRFLSVQITAGADCIQLFESWGGAAPHALLLPAILNPTQRIVAALREKHPGIPIIAFPRGLGLSLPSYTQVVCPDGLSLDDTVPPPWALKNLSSIPCLQGGLDPMALLAGGKVLVAQTDELLETYEERPFIFNLGHGISKDTPPSHVEDLIRQIRAFKADDKNRRCSL